MKNRTAHNAPQTPDEYRALAASRLHLQRLAGDSAAPHDLAPTEAERLERQMQRRHMYAALAVLALVCLVLVLA